VGALDPVFKELIEAIVAGDEATATALLGRSPALATAWATVGATRTDAEQFYFAAVGHYLYAGDSRLHMAAAGYRVPICRVLIDDGADVTAANRRGAQPLHYAADGNPDAPTWNPAAQGETVTLLVEAGADPNATDKSGVAPLHRAVRTRSTGAVAALLAGGADPRLPNKNGSTPLELAQRTTGRGGSGSPAAKEEQEAIIRLLEAR
jgi:hypothetical protein